MNDMNLFFRQTLASGYKNRSQKIRVLSEAWVGENLYCPRCGCTPLRQFPNNQPVADFYCPACENVYELKSRGGSPGHRIPDGAYHTFLRRITSDSNPDFFLLCYHPAEYRVTHLWVIMKQFFVPEIVEKRKPLPPSARRAGWTGCNILLDSIPEQGKIPIVKNDIPVPRDVVLEQVRRAASLGTKDIAARGWMVDILLCVNRIPSETFTLSDLYRFEPELAAKHPENHNIQAKIRQQAQFLRDRGFLAFIGRGIYRKRF